MRRLVVKALEKTDEALDWVLYRPAVVKAFLWVPRWWQCDLAKLSIRLDDRWGTGVHADEGLPGPLCAACRRRAAWTEIGGWDPDWGEPDPEDFLYDRVVPLCGWCHVHGQILNETEFQAALREAAADSIAMAMAMARPSITEPPRDSWRL